MKALGCVRRAGGWVGGWVYYLEAVLVSRQELGEGAGGDGGVLHRLEHVGEGAHDGLEALGEAGLGLLGWMGGWVGGNGKIEENEAEIGMSYWT